MSFLVENPTLGFLFLVAALVLCWVVVATIRDKRSIQKLRDDGYNIHLPLVQRLSERAVQAKWPPVLLARCPGVDGYMETIFYNYISQYWQPLDEQHFGLFAQQYSQLLHNREHRRRNVLGYDQVEFHPKLPMPQPKQQNMMDIVMWPFVKAELVVRLALSYLGLLGDITMALLLLVGLVAVPAAWLLGWPWWSLLLAGLYNFWAVVAVWDFTRFRHAAQSNTV